MTQSSIHFGKKIRLQLPKRGWTEEDVKSLYEHPSRIDKTVDQRHNPDGTQNNEVATIYYQSDGHYIICNDRTGDVVQVSNRNDANWINPLQ